MSPIEEELFREIYIELRLRYISIYDIQYNYKINILY